MRKTEEYVMEELDEFFEEGKRRQKRLRLLIDDLRSKKDLSYTSGKLVLGKPIKKTFVKKVKQTRLKDKNNDKGNLF